MEVKLPNLGEGIEGASVSFWYKKVGDSVREGEDLVEMTTEKASFTLPAPGSGKVTRVNFGEGDTVKVDEVLAIIE